MSPSEPRPTPIQIRRTVEAGGDAGVELSVFCVCRNASVTVDTCLGCEECGGLQLDPSERNTFLMCRGDPRPSSVPDEPIPGSRVDPPVAKVMTAHVVCVRAELPLDELTQLMLERGISGVPVVDDSGRPLGVVSKTDLLRRRLERSQQTEVDEGPVRAGQYELELGPGFGSGGLSEDIVEDIMMPIALTIPENAPISKAAALMAHEGVHRLVVVDAHSSAVVGILSAIDLLRWMARQHGYAVPLAPERDAHRSGGSWP
ncbi:MAG: CBS domain-containing protein [Polyangiaceae bacterium]